jgi:hypothetical protein
MKKLLLGFALLFLLKDVKAQYSSSSVIGLVVPQYITAGDSTRRLPAYVRLRLDNLKPKSDYRYVIRGIKSSDFSSKTISPGAGNPLYVDTAGNYRYYSGTAYWTATAAPKGDDTLTTGMMGEFEGWFGLVGTGSVNYWTSGNKVYLAVIAIGITTGDTVKMYCSDSMTVITPNAVGNVKGTGVWGKSMAPAKSFVALYDNTMGTGRPLSVGPVEGGIFTGSSLSSLVGYYSTSVWKVSGNWAGIVPNSLSNGIKRVDNLSLKTGMSIFSNTDGDAIWGPSKKNTVNRSGGYANPIYLDYDDAALTPTLVEFWSRTSSTKEDVGKYSVFVSRKYSGEKDQTVRFYVAGGTCTKGATADYTLTERTITFKGSGKANYDTTVITINDDNSAEGPETIVLGLDQPSNCVIGVEKAHTITVVDNDIANVIVQNTTVVVKENAGKIGITLKMDKPVSAASKMMLLVKSKGDSTYIPSEFSIGKSGKDSTFNLGSTTKGDSIVIYAKVFDDFNIDPNDTVRMVLRQITGGAYIKDSIITLVMLDNDGPATIEFIDSKLTVAETVGTVSVRMRIASRSDADADFTLRCYTALSSATEGVDFKFNPTSKIINITSTTKDTIIVDVPFYNDYLYEPTKKVYFGLGTLSNSKIAKGKDTLIITLLNDDLPIYNIGTVNKQTNANKVADSLNAKCRVFGTVYGVNMRTAGMNFTMIDGTGGMGVFTNPKTFGYSVTEGDSIMVQGTVSQFQGLVQMDKLDTIIKISSGRTLKKAAFVQGVDETTESKLVQFRRVKLVDATEWPSAALAVNGFKNVRVMNTSGRVDTLNIDAETNIDGSSAPVGYFDVTGLGGQFDNSAPYTTRYVLSPRYMNDLKVSALPTVNFTKASDQVFEPADSFRMDFSVIPADENFTFDVAIAGGTAISPKDYDFATRKINVVKNVSSFFIRANITDDGDPDGDKTLIFAIRNGQGPCYLGKDTLLTLLIKDNEASVVKRFDAGSIKMYPNPTNGSVKVDCNQAMRSIKVYTMSGQLVHEMNLVSGSNRAAEFTMSGTPGLYRVQVVTESGDLFSDFLSFQ